MKSKLFQRLPAFKTSRSQKGFTLIELIIALSVIGIGVGGILVFQSSAENRQRVVGATQGLAGMVGKTKAAWLPSGSYAGLNAGALGAAGFIESPYRLVGANLVDPWANNMGLNNNSLDNRWFGLTISPPNADTCVALSTAMAGIADRLVIAGAAPAWDDAGANIAAFHPLPNGGEVGKAGPGAVVNPGNVAAGCSVAAPVISMSFQ